MNEEFCLLRTIYGVVLWSSVNVAVHEHVRLFASVNLAHRDDAEQKKNCEREQPMAQRDGHAGSLKFFQPDEAVGDARRVESQR